MKAAVYYEAGDPTVLRYEEVPDPACPADGIVIQVEAISIEGGDILHRAEGRLRSRPHIVGFQCAGIIKEVGPDVKDRAPGQRVVATMDRGSHAELAPASAQRTWLIPDGLSSQLAACIPIPFGTADDALFEFGRLRAGETVLVQGGAGGVGLAAIQLAKRAGATVFATASSDEKLERLKEYGLDHGINYRDRDFVAALKEITEGRGVDVVLDPVGTTLQQSIICLAYRGRALFVGNSGRAPTTVDIIALFRGNQSLSAVHPETGTDRVRKMIDRHLEDVASGKLKVVIDRTYPLAEAAAAHAYIESRQAFGRVLLIP